MQALNKEEFQRYSRHILLPNIGVEGQLKLKKSKVLIVGAGGLGIPVMMYLAAAGVGTLGIVDFDTIDLSNLQRQVIYKAKDVGLLKAAQAKSFIEDQNPNTEVIIYTDAIQSNNALEIIKSFDFVIDGTDNFPTRYLLNDAAVLLDKAYVYGSIYRFEGQVSVFNFLTAEGRGPNYRDLFPVPPHPDLVPNCSEGGVIGVLPGIVGSLQALEAIKMITGIGEILSGRLLTIDTLNNQYRSFKFKKRADNPLNGDTPTITQLIDYEEFCNPISLKNNVLQVASISVFEFSKWQNEGKPFQLIDVRETYEYDIVNIGGHLYPKSDIENHISEIEVDIPVVFLCRSGKRSSEVIALLNEKYDFKNLVNLEGGLLEYAAKIDSSMVIY